MTQSKLDLPIYIITNSYILIVHDLVFKLSGFQSIFDKKIFCFIFYTWNKTEVSDRHINEIPNSNFSINYVYSNRLDTIHFLLYENLQFSKKMNQKLLFYQKDCIVWFKNNDFTLPMYLPKHGLWRLFSGFHTENENPFRMWSNEALRWMFKS